MAGSKGTQKIKQRTTPEEKRQQAASKTRKAREAYYIRKNFVLGREPENFKKICVIEYEKGWWRMFDHSALLYKHVIGNELDFQVRIHKDEDNGKGKKAEYGIVFIKNLDSLKDKMKRVKAEKIHEKGGILIFELRQECSREKMKAFEGYEEDCWAQVNKVILPEVSMPGLKSKLSRVISSVHRIVHKMPEDERASFGTEIDQMSGKLYSDFLLMSNGLINKLKYLVWASRQLQEIKSKIGIISELKITTSGKIFELLKDVENAVKLVEVERRVAEREVEKTSTEKR